MKPAQNLRMNSASTLRQVGREHIAADALSAKLAHSITLTELQHTRVQARLMAALLAGSLLCDLTDPALLLVGSTASLVYRAAQATSLGPTALAIVMTGLAVLLLPFLVAQIAGLESRRRGVTQLACLSLALTSVVWFFLAWRCIPLDLGAAPWVFTRYGAGALLFALAIAWSLNAEQLRIALERTP